MSKTKFELNRSGVRDLLLSDEMMEVCSNYASRARSTLGSGYELSPYSGKNRVNVAIVASTKEAVKDNLKNNTLLKALGGASD